MSNAEQFITTSDFATLKNDAQTTMTLTLPGSLVIAASGDYLNTTTATVGAQGAVDRTLIYTSKVPYYWIGNTMELEKTGTRGGSPSIYTVRIQLYRSSATQMTAQVYIFNPTGTLTTEAGDETFTFYVNTFIPPFE